MRPALQLKLSAQLTLTPQLTQAIKLLAMSNLELTQELNAIIESNPVLEMEFDQDGDSDRDSDHPEREIDGIGATDAAALDLSASTLRDRDSEFSQTNNESNDSTQAQEQAESEAPADAQSVDDGGHDLDCEFDSSDLRDWGSGAGGDEDDERSYDRGSGRGTSLIEHLRWQLDLTPFSAFDRAIAEVLVESVEDDGYLREPVDYQRAALAPEVMATAAQVESVRARLMHFEPLGVLARNLSECLIVQLKQAKHVRRLLAVELIEKHFDQLARGDCAKLAKAVEAEPCEVAAALQLIKQMNPRPGARFEVGNDEYVIPDVEVRKRNGVWQVKLNPLAQPRLKISNSYERFASRAKREEANYIKTQLTDAKQLLKSLAQREDTVVRVAEAIVKEQTRFFDHGVEYMKPLVLRQIADMCGLHESTVSRVTTRKYMHTPRGLFEFKHFFSSGVATRDGGEAAATAIQEMIRKLIDTEEGRKPLSDSTLADLLKARGVIVARRTVAKYREALNIPSSQERVRHG